MSEWNSFRGKSNGMINVTFVAIIKFIKVGRVWSRFDWYLLQRRPCPDLTLCPCIPSGDLFAGSNHTTQFTAVSKYDVVFSHRGHPDRLSSSNSFAASSAGMYLRTDLLSDSDWPTFPLYLFVLVAKICQPSLQQGGPRINGYERRPLWSPELWLILVSEWSGGWHVITLAVTQERHRETDSQSLRRADTERWRQLWGDLKQCADWDIIYWYLLAGCGRIKDVLNYIRVSEVSIMSTRWNSFKWIFYLARIFSRQSSI